jgi:hypothetical protein
VDKKARAAVLVHSSRVGGLAGNSGAHQSTIAHTPSHRRRWLMHRGRTCSSAMMRTQMRREERASVQRRPSDQSTEAPRPDARHCWLLPGMQDGNATDETAPPCAKTEDDDVPHRRRSCIAELAEPPQLQVVDVGDECSRSWPRPARTLDLASGGSQSS